MPPFACWYMPPYTVPLSALDTSRYREGMWMMSILVWPAALVRVFLRTGLHRSAVPPERLEERVRRGKPFPIPCHRLQPRWCHKQSVASAFQQRIDAAYARKKRWFAGAALFVVLHAFVIARAPLQFLFPQYVTHISLIEIKRRFLLRERYLDLLAKQAHFAMVVFGIAGRAGGIAGRCRYHGPSAFLGVERLCWRHLTRPLRNSILDHELTHCQQELLYGALTLECHSKSWLLRQFHFVFVELHAHLFGGPLAFAAGLTVVCALIGSAFVLSRFVFSAVSALLL